MVLALRRAADTDARSLMWVLGGTLAHLCGCLAGRSCRHDLKVDVSLYVSGRPGKD